MGIRRCRALAALLFCGAAAACVGQEEDSISAPEVAEVAERWRVRAAAVGLWGDHDGWSVVQAPEPERRLPEEGEPTALL